MDTTLEKTVSTIWSKSKVLVKGLIIGMLALLLLIPTAFVKELVYERDGRQRMAAQEISSKWAGPQNIIGPIIGVPFVETTIADNGKNTTATKLIAYFLPDDLSVNAVITPKEKHRGIYKVMLYESKNTINGSFARLPLDKLNIPAEKFLWQEAFVKFSIADTKGLNDQLKLKWKDTEFELNPQTDGNDESMTALLRTTSAEDFNNVSFSLTANLNGSEQLLFTPIGKTTNVTIESSWKHPSFSGSILPQTTNVKDSGFKASWKSLSHKRSFPQQWLDQAYKTEFVFPLKASIRDERFLSGDVIPGSVSSSSAILSESSFGVNLFVPVNDYQKILRTVKYAVLCILLTFAAFFLIETNQQKSVHPFHYGLIGLALVLFYTLLLSFSEYVGFNTAYLISSFATIGLIGWFVRSLLQSGRATTIIGVVLVLVYSYIFSLLQLQDYSLLLGSIGLFLSLATIMYFSRKIKW
jgi:inner membrane protein